MTDQELLDQYARTGDPAAFRALVAAHVDLVHSCARRGVRDPHLADDVTQVVFTILARKAASIPRGTVLEGWLFKTTRYATANALRNERRRQAHERRAATMAHTRQTPDAAYNELEPHLEDAIARLKGPERDAVLLRYFKSMTMRQVADALAIGEDAAAKRVSRALERMRQFFAARGLSVSAAALGSTMAANAVQAAPAALADAVAAASLAPAAGAASAGAAEVLRAIAWAKAKTVLTGSLAAALALALATWLTMLATAQIAVSGGGPTTRPAPRPAPTTRQVPGVAPGWPVMLPGHSTGTPAVADLDGDGALEIVAPSMYRGGGNGQPADPVAHPQPRVERLLHAYRPDGTPMPGWPATVMDAATRQRERDQLKGIAEYWSTSPSVLDWRGAGRDQVAITSRLGVITIDHASGGPQVRQIANQGDAWANVPLADLDGDGRVDLVMGWVLKSIGSSDDADDGDAEVPGWPQERILRGGFAPAISDAFPDNEPRLYHPYYAQTATIGGYDRFGRSLPGWPQTIVGHCREGPSLGDLDGDGLPEVVATNGGTIYAWTWDGQPLPGTRHVGRTRGVFKQGLSLPTSPTVADLDGDGKAEVVVFDQSARAIKAWRGDGTGLTSPDGTLVRLDGAPSAGGVSVADLGGDGVLDLLAGTWWVRLSKDGNTQILNMLPTPADTDQWCTIADVNRDGAADITFVTSDGRLYVYDTGLPYKPEWVLWQTRGGNMRRTGGAKPPPFKPANSASPATAPPALVVVKVIDAATHAPVPRALLTMDMRAGDVRARCGDQGTYAMPLRDQRWLGVLAEAPGYAPVRAAFEGWSQPSEERVIPLPKAVPIGGTIRDAEGNAVAGATVFIVAQARINRTTHVDARQEVVTDAQGRWRSDRVPERYDGLWLRVEHPAYVTEDARVGRTEKSAAALRGATSQLVLRKAGKEVTR
jgi:RNA polymerase sigma factor (sigma-70 family)